MNDDELSRMKYMGYLYTVVMYDKSRTDGYSEAITRLENCLEIHYCISGEEKIWINGEKILFSQDHVRILPPINCNNEHLSIKTVKKSKIIGIGFITPNPFVTENIVLDAKNNPKIKTLFEKLIYIWNTKYENFFFEATSVFFLLLKELRLLESENFSKPEHIAQKLQPAVSYIHDHYTEQCFEFSVLPEMCGLKNNYFHKLFQKRYETSPSKYVTRLRMTLATELLFMGRLSISEIARQTGYESVSYFSRVFKNYFGIAPSKYTKMTQKYSEYL